MEDKKWKAYFWLSLLVWVGALFLASPLHGQQSSQGYWITADELTALETALIQAQTELKQSQEELKALATTTAALQTELATLKTSYAEYEQEVTVQRGALISLVVVLSGVLIYQIVTDN